MKKIISIILALAMVLTMSVPAFADDTTAEESTPAQLTSAQVKAIKPAAKAASYSYTKIKVSWDKIDGVDGYKVYRATSKNGKYSLAYTAAATKASYINTGRTTGKTYYYKVRAYKVIDGKTVYSKYSAVTSAYARPNKAKINKVYLPKDGQVKVTWSKVSGATGYQVYRKRADKNTWKLFKSVSSKSTAVTDKLLGNASKPFGAGGETWYDHADMKYTWEYKVRAYRTVNEKQVYGLFSSPVAYECPWTKDELINEISAYGKSLSFPVYEYANPDGSPNDDGEYLVPKKDGSSYHFDSYVATEKGSSWSVLWPALVNPYRTKNSILKEIKSGLKTDLNSVVASNPMHWAKADIEGAFGPNGENEYWDGSDCFGIYFEKYLNGYRVWILC